MKASNFVIGVVVAGLFAAVSISAQTPPPTEDPTKMPLRFEENRGQTDDRVRYLTRNAGYTLFLTPNEAIVSLDSAKGAASFRMSLVDGREGPVLTGEEELRGKSNYFRGNNPEGWTTGVRSYGRVRYSDVYPGIDLVYYGNPAELEHDFVIDPGVRPEQIRMKFEGIDGMEIDARGDLILRVSEEEVRLLKPVVYQESETGRDSVGADYVLRGEDEAAFLVAAYDSARPLIIDPVLSYSSYLGGSAADLGSDLVVDAAGNVYVAGRTGSSNFPTQNLLFPDSPGFDAFLTKLNPAGDALVYSTYFGGAGTDQGTAVAVDGSGNAYLAGVTTSVDFPATDGAFRTAITASQDMFALKLNAAGDELVYSTFIGSNGIDTASGLAIDDAGNAYIVGSTNGSTFPTKNAIQSMPGGGIFDLGDALVLKLNSAGDQLVYSTYLGGSERELAGDIAIDGSGDAYVVGWTRSTNFPVVNTPDPLDPIQGGSAGGDDVFVSKLTENGIPPLSLVYSTYLGGSGMDIGRGIAVDGAGNAYVTGSTASANFPIIDTADPLDPIQLNNAGGGDGFALKLNAAGNGIVYSTYFGGTGADVGTAVAVDASGNAYLTGITTSVDFPLVDATQLAFGGGRDDAIAAKINAAANKLEFSTYLGGNGIDDGNSIALDGAGVAYVTGNTDSTDFPVVGPFQAASGGAADAFVAEISGLMTVTPVLPPNAIVNGASFRAATDPNGALAPGAIVSAFGADFAAAVQRAAQVPLPTVLGGTSLLFGGTASPLFVVGGGQINAQVPFDAPPGVTTAQVQRGTETSALQQVTIAAVSPGIFSLNQQGTGQGAVLLANTATFAAAVGSIPGQVAQPVARGSFISIFCTGLGDVTPRPPSAGLSVTLLTPTVTIGGIDVAPTFSGLTAFVGLYQVDVLIPANAPTGAAVTLVITIGGVPSNTVTIAIQ